MNKLILYVFKIVHHYSVKRREGKSKGEKERYTNLNSEFQRIARRDKKAFLSNQCTEIEENKRMGKTRDLFKKIRDTKGTFQARREWQDILKMMKENSLQISSRKLEISREHFMQRWAQ